MTSLKSDPALFSSLARLYPSDLSVAPVFKAYSNFKLIIDTSAPTQMNEAVHTYYCSSSLQSHAESRADWHLAVTHAEIWVIYCQADADILGTIRYHFEFFLTLTARD